MAGKSSLLLSRLKLGKSKAVEFQINGKHLMVPSAAVQVLKGTLNNMAKGKSVAVVSLDEEVSTQEAAELLNVSRPFAAKLFDKGAIPSRKVGTHRRILFSDLMAFKQRSDARRQKVLDDLVAQAQEEDMGY